MCICKKNITHKSCIGLGLLALNGSICVLLVFVHLAVVETEIGQVGAVRRECNGVTLEIRRIRIEPIRYAIVYCTTFSCNIAG